MSVAYKFSFTLYRAIYIDKYTNIKCKEVVKRVCVGGKRVHALALITVPSLNRFSSPLAH